MVVTRMEQMMEKLTVDGLQAGTLFFGSLCLVCMHSLLTGLFRWYFNKAYAL